MNQPLYGLIRLEGGCNFRQISAHAAHAGRRLRPGKLFRSGVLAYFSDLDHAQLSNLRIRTIVDLRRADERRREPTRWYSQDVLTLAADAESAPASLLRIALRTAQSESKMREAMIDTYRAMPEVLAPQLQLLFESVHRGETPVLIHCAAGKDRTGFAIAVLLEALGVSRASVMQDYLYTNEAVDLEQFVLAHHPVARNPEARSPMRQLSAEVRNALLGAHAEYLQAAFAAVDRDYGCVEGYLEQRLGVDAPKLEQIRSTLLE